MERRSAATGPNTAIHYQAAMTFAAREPDGLTFPTAPPTVKRAAQISKVTSLFLLGHECMPLPSGVTVCPTRSPRTRGAGTLCVEYQTFAEFANSLQSEVAARCLRLVDSRLEESVAPHDIGEEALRLLLKGASRYEFKEAAPFNLSKVSLPSKAELTSCPRIAKVVAPWCLKYFEGDWRLWGPWLLCNARNDDAGVASRQTLRKNDSHEQLDSTCTPRLRWTVLVAM